jgi:hypothetical protein
MRILVSLFSVIALGGSLISQTLADAYWNRIKERADSVVISRFGTDFFIHHIFAPEYPLDYIVVGEYSCLWEDRDTITGPPTSCYFEYDIGLDPMHVARLNISFSITPEGRLLEDGDLKGFVADGSPVKFKTDLKGFIALAKQQGVKCRRSEAYRDLRWVPLGTTVGINPGGVGRYELVLGRRIRGTHTEEVQHSIVTYQVFDTIVVDPFSGAVLRKEKRREILLWASDVRFL